MLHFGCPLSNQLHVVSQELSTFDILQILMRGNTGDEWDLQAAATVLLFKSLLPVQEVIA